MKKNKNEVEVYYQARAKHLVDILFDRGLFIKGVSRDDMQSIEDVIAYEYQSSANSEKRCTEFLAEIKKGNQDDK